MPKLRSRRTRRKQQKGSGGKMKNKGEKEFFQRMVGRDDGTSAAVIVTNDELARIRDDGITERERNHLINVGSDRLLDYKDKGNIEFEFKEVKIDPKWLSRKRKEEEEAYERAVATSEKKKKKREEEEKARYQRWKKAPQEVGAHSSAYRDWIESKNIGGGNKRRRTRKKRRKSRKKRRKSRKKRKRSRRRKRRR